MPLTDDDIAAIAVLISQQRLQALSELTGSTRTAITLHQATLGLNAELMNVIASIELALRNSVCENLTIYFGGPGWLIRPTAPFQWKTTENQNAQKALDSARRAAYSKMTQAEKSSLDALAYPRGMPSNVSHLKRAINRRRQLQVSDGQLIAELTFYFWKRLYSADYEHGLWRTTLKKTFPNKTLKRPQVADKLETVYQARNRLAHHEPVLHKRFRDTIEAIEFIAQNLGASTPSIANPLAKLIAEDLDKLKLAARELHNRLDGFRVP